MVYTQIDASPATQLSQWTNRALSFSQPIIFGSTTSGLNADQIASGVTNKFLTTTTQTISGNKTLTGTTTFSGSTSGLSADNITAGASNVFLTPGVAQTISGNKTLTGTTTFSGSTSGLSADNITAGTSNVFLTPGVTQTLSQIVAFQAVPVVQAGISVGITTTSNSIIGFYASGGGGTPTITNVAGKISMLTGTQASAACIGSSQQKITVGSSLGVVMTTAMLTIPNGLGAIQGGITILGSTANSTISTSLGANTLSIASGTGAGLQLCVGSTAFWSIGSTGTTVYTPQFLNFTPAVDKLITFANTGGNTTLGVANASGNVTFNVPASGTYTFQQNGTTIYSTDSSGNSNFQDNVTLQSTLGFQKTGTNKTVTYVNTAGNTTVSVTDSTGAITTNVPTGASHTFQVGGTTIATVSGAGVAASLLTIAPQTITTGTYATASFTSNYILVDLSGGSVVINLSVASTNVGCYYIIKVIKQSSSNSLTLQNSLYSTKLDGSTSFVMTTTNYTVYRIYSSGSDTVGWLNY